MGRPRACEARGGPDQMWQGVRLRLNTASVVAVAAVLSALAAAPAGAAILTEDLTGGLTAEDLARELAGRGVAVSNVTYTGAPQAAGDFAVGDPPIGFPEGVILSSGAVRGVVGPNNSDRWTANNGNPGDPDLDANVGGGTLDAAVLEFDFVPTKDRVFFSYVFGSEEYNEYVGSAFNDTFAFFINGENCALIPGTNTPVAINNVNNGANSSFYRDNSTGTPTLDTQLDGITTVLTCEATVTPDQTNHIKLAVADRGDRLYDSDVFLQAGSFSTEPVNRPPVAELAATPASGPHPLPVTFDGSASFDPDGPIASWELDLGDGTPPLTGSGTPPAAIDHTYTEVGEHTASLRVIDPRDVSDTDTFTVHVRRAAPVLTTRSLVAEALPGAPELLFPRLTARLARTNPSEPLADRLIRFYAGSTEVCQDTTDAAGEASCKDVVISARTALRLGYRAQFQGDGRYLPVGSWSGLLRVDGSDIPEEEQLP